MVANLNLSGLNRIKKELEKIDKLEVAIGLLSDKVDSDLIIAASANEFGAKIKITPKMRGFLHSIGIHVSPAKQYIIIPERSVYRANLEENKTKYQYKIRDSLNKIIEGKSLTVRELKKLGFTVETDIKKKIKSLSTPANAPATIKKKGANNPLIDTGRTRNSVSSEVRNKR